MKLTLSSRTTLILASTIVLPFGQLCASEASESASVWAQPQQTSLVSDLLNGDEQQRYHAVFIAQRLGPDRMSDDVRLALMAFLDQTFDKYDVAKAQGIPGNEVVNVEFTNSVVELVSELNDVRSIPILVRSGGYGYSRLAVERLASFGEDALPVMLEELEKTESSTAIGFNLRAFRMMVEEKGVDTLSVWAREEIVQAASNGLRSAGVSSLSNAIGLAAALNEPELVQTVHEISMDEGYLEARGLLPTSIEMIRRDAAEVLARDPPGKEMLRDLEP